jgi:hypothetical protein
MIRRSHHSGFLMSRFNDMALTEFLHSLPVYFIHGQFLSQKQLLKGQ